MSNKCCEDCSQKLSTAIAPKLLFISSTDQGLSKQQEVGSAPVTEVKKIILVFWCNKKIDPDRYVSCGSYEL